MGLEEVPPVQPIEKSIRGLSIDPAFVLKPEFRPTRKHDEYDTSGGDVPSIDLAPLRSSNVDGELKRRLVQEVANACRDWGFFQVINHGIAPQVLDHLEREMKTFFNLSLDEKRKITRTSSNPMGYYDTELTKNVRDWKEVFDFVQGTVEIPQTYDEEEKTKSTAVYNNVWPQHPAGLRDACNNWTAAVEKIAFELLSLITESMGLPASYFHKDFKDENTTFIRLNHYPECPNPELALGVSRHKDGGALTVLWQDEVGGLQVKRKDGEWIAVKPRRDAFVINVGDIVQVWSNDKYISVEHRVVVNEQKERYSIPYFFNPHHTTDIFPVPALLDDEHPPKYRRYNWGYFLKRRKDGNYKNMGENLQISNYAINRN